MDLGCGLGVPHRTQHVSWREVVVGWVEGLEEVVVGLQGGGYLARI